MQFSRKRPSYFIYLLCALIISFFVIFGSLKTAKPIIIVTAQTTAVNHATTSLNKTVEEYLNSMNIHYSDVAQLQTDANGEVVAIRIDSMALNRIKTGVTAKIAEIFADLQTIHPNIPIGTLTGSNFLMGKGLKIPFSVSYSATAESELNNLFVTRGINQTQHQIVLQVTAKINILSSGNSHTVEIKTQLTIAETVIVGLIPEIYAGAEDELWPNLVE